MRNLLSTPSPNNKSKVIIKLIIIFALGVILFWAGRQSWFPIKINFQSISFQLASDKKELDSSSGSYSAVYLTNNQVYFGQVVEDQDPYLVMTDIYYFRQRNLPTEGKVQLIKLGNELHGPQDKIFFNKSQITFTQQLKEDSQIVKAMIKYGEEPQSPLGSSVEISDYVAVFLVNNQVYFGKLTKPESLEPVLTDVFYLKVQQGIQPDETDNSGDQTDVKKAQPKTDFKLIKLGNEVHGPTDQVKLNRDQIFFWEKLRADSKVVEAIKTYQEQQNN